MRIPMAMDSQMVSMTASIPILRYPGIPRSTDRVVRMMMAMDTHSHPYDFTGADRFPTESTQWFDRDGDGDELGGSRATSAPMSSVDRLILIGSMSCISSSPARTRARSEHRG